jgi:hypothetical protein
VGSNNSTVDAAVSLIAAGLVEKCGARSPVLTAGYVLKYERGGMPQHADEEGRYGAVVSLNAPGLCGGFKAPTDLFKYRAPNLVQRNKRQEYDHRKAMGHKSWEPHFQYDDICSQTCAGLSCDDMLQTGHTLEQLTTKWKCDCTFCSKAMPPLKKCNGSFDGGGTRFSALRDVLFVGDVGDAVLYGAHVRHGAEPVLTKGSRFVLALFFDDGRCASAEDDWDTFVTSLGVFVLLAALVAIALTDFDDQKAAATPDKQTNDNLKHQQNKRKNK